MAIRVRTQKDYLLTEVTIDLPTDFKEIDEYLRGSRSSARVVSLYNQGSVLGINIEQRAKVTEAQSLAIRELLGISDAIF